MKRLSECVSNSDDELYNFFFITPLYSGVSVKLSPRSREYPELIGEDEDNLDIIQVTEFLANEDFKLLKRIVTKQFSIYGYCPVCEKTVYLNADNIPLDKDLKSNILHSEININSQETFDFAYEHAEDKMDKLVRMFISKYLDSARSFSRYFTCSSPNKHSIKVMFTYNIDGTLVKTGQYPSIYDFDNKIKVYKKIISKEDYRELNKAVGLKTHGNGIGAFVYLRRIFERLINQKLNKKFDKEELNQLMTKKVTEKIESVKDLLPEFVVNNKHLYGILSKGIHQLEEESCLEYFETVKNAIVFILEEEDQRKKREQIQKELALNLGEIKEKTKEAE